MPRLETCSVFKADRLVRKSGTYVIQRLGKSSKQKVTHNWCIIIEYSTKVLSNLLTLHELIVKHHSHILLVVRIS
jgi:hypothetical protein